MSADKHKTWQRTLWIFLLAPGLLQFILLCIAMFGRVGYGYDLEWMEGGLLTHAQRIADGKGIYVAPSVDFIPFLYTPLYPGIIAMFSELFGIGYGVARTLSILSTISTGLLLVLIVRRESNAPTKALSWLGGICALGFFSATYPWVEGWYDLVRADALFLLMVIGGLWGLRNWAKTPGHEGMAKLSTAAALLALSFFAKQTGILFVVAGGFMVLFINWRRTPLYIGVTGLIGLGGTWLLNRVTGGWFWIYIYKTHQNHDFNMDRFYKSFGNILWHFPILSIVIVSTLLMVVLTYGYKRKIPPPAKGFIIWTPIFAMAVLVGAIGWGTQFAHFNAYIPAMLFGSLSAGLAIPTFASCVSLWMIDRKTSHQHSKSQWVGLVLSGILSAQLLQAWWSPSKFIPGSEEHKAGHTLIATLEAIEGDIFIPYHPWYAHLAGKKTHAHLMGLRDMSTGKSWPIAGLNQAMESQSFAAILLDNRPVGNELRRIHRHYRMNDFLPSTASPHVFTGAGAVWNKKVQTLIPRSLWIPSRPIKIPDDTSILWDFEDGGFEHWYPPKKSKKKQNMAWGSKPVSRPLPKQGPVRRYGGQYYLSSFHGEDKSTGTLQSPTFVIEGSTILFRLSGGHSKDLRVELRIEGEVIYSATGSNSERMEDIAWNVAAYSGKLAQIILIDNDKGPWGHLNVDEFWLKQ